MDPLKKSAIPEKFSICNICKAGLGDVRMDTPLYCVACLEGMERLSMSPKSYRKQRELEQAAKKPTLPLQHQI